MRGSKSNGYFSNDGWNCANRAVRGEIAGLRNIDGADEGACAGEAGIPAPVLTGYENVPTQKKFPSGS